MITRFLPIKIQIKHFIFGKKISGYDLNLDGSYQKNVDVYIIPYAYYKHGYSVKKDGYCLYLFNGYTYVKNRLYEPEGYAVWVKEK